MENDIGGEAPDLSEEEIARELMTAYLVDHYKRLHDVVEKKLAHAKTATRRSIDRAERDDGDAAAGTHFEKLDAVWAEIIGLFRKSGLTTGDMEAIEQVLEAIPATIKSYYTDLVDHDRQLVRMIETMAAEEYQNAYSKAQEIADRLGVKTDFTLDDDGRPVVAQDQGEVEQAAQKAYMILRGKPRK
ncbi:MAG: hypothetical protein H6867_05035 [Rhodospirillales bacterium]|nr:hypothetical protein [Rhodospirillales bacterium]MCB9994892.1 hypothetical protein [Rhodospirillales bacterium]